MLVLLLTGAGESSKKRKRETECPVRKCRKLVYDLPKHLRRIHNWHDIEARNVKLLFGLRKEYTYKIPRGMPKYKDSHYRKECPIDDCRSVVLKLTRHLVNVHKIARNSVELKFYQGKAVTVDSPTGKSKISRKMLHKTHKTSLSHVLTEGELLESSSDDSDYIEDDSNESEHNYETGDVFKDCDTLSGKDLFPSDEDEYGEDNDDEDIDIEDDLLGVEESVNDMLELFYQF